MSFARHLSIRSKLIPVSYTHLDVYKRQLVYVQRVFSLPITFVSRLVSRRVAALAGIRKARNYCFQIWNRESAASARTG